MVGETKKYRCTKCRGEYNTEDIRLMPDSKVVCLYCLGKKERSIASEQVKQEKSDEEHVDYMCVNCKYQFKRKKSQVIKVCPYCGKEGKVVLKAKVTADRILSDSNDDY